MSRAEARHILVSEQDLIIGRYEYQLPYVHEFTVPGIVQPDSNFCKKLAVLCYRLIEYYCGTSAMCTRFKAVYINSITQRFGHRFHRWLKV